MLDNLLIMWYSSAILNQEVNFMKYVGSKARLSKQLAPIIQSYIGGMADAEPVDIDADIVVVIAIVVMLMS